MSDSAQRSVSDRLLRELLRGERPKYRGPLHGDGSVWRVQDRAGDTARPATSGGSEPLARWPVQQPWVKPTICDDTRM